MSNYMQKLYKIQISCPYKVLLDYRHAHLLAHCQRQSKKKTVPTETVSLAMPSLFTMWSFTAKAKTSGCFILLNRNATLKKNSKAFWNFEDSHI